MSNKRLYVIGNGFDLFHGVKSKYTDFKNFVKINNKDLLNVLEEYFEQEELWADFEGTLAFLDTDRIIEDASGYLVSYGAENWRDSNNHDYQFEIQRIIHAVTVELKANFSKWILGLKIPKTAPLYFPKSSIFLTFNYTNTLEQNYGIPASNILYIHNKAVDSNSTLILGHSRVLTDHNSTLLIEDDDLEDVRVREGDIMLDKYFKTTYKDTERLIIENEVFFNELFEIEEIFILGHSLSDIDQKYFHKIYNVVSKEVIWTVSYHLDTEKSEKLDFLKGIGVQEGKIKLIKIQDLL